MTRSHQPLEESQLDESHAKVEQEKVQSVQLQRLLREREAVAAINAALADSQDLDQVLELIVQATLTIIPNAAWAAIHLLQEEKERLSLLACAGLDLATGEYDLRLGQGVAGRVMLEGKVINVADLQEDPRRLSVDQSLGVRALLVAPLKSRTQITGTLSVQSKTPHSFTTNDEQLLATLGIQAGMVIENARLFATQKHARRIAERRREQMRRLASRLVMAQEEERRRISRELHDESGQLLTSLKISLDLLRNDIPQENEPVQETLGELIDLADKTMSSLRLLAHNLRPPDLAAYGLAASVSGLCQDFVAHSALQIDYESVDLPGLPKLTELSLYRLTQEALTNVLKHAKASRVSVSFEDEEQQITLKIQDNGQGFDLEQARESSDSRNGFGIVGMLERLDMIGGQLDIHTAPGQGTRLIAKIPVTKGKEKT